MGDEVYIRNFSPGLRWIPGHICATVGNVSFDVTLSDGRTFRHHVDHLRKRFVGDIGTTETEISLPPVVSNHSEVTPELCVGHPNSNVVADPSTIDPSTIDPSTIDPSTIDPPTTDSTSDSHSPSETRYPERVRRPPDRYTP